MFGYIVLALIVVYIIIVIYESFSSNKHNSGYIQTNVNRMIGDTDEKPHVNQKSMWGGTREEVFELYGKFCNRCSLTTNLHVHHKLPLSFGGTNKLNNLEVLCEECHQKIHKHKLVFETTKDIDNYGFDTKILDKKIKRVVNAIQNECSITIKYTDIKGKKTKRTISPSEIYREKGSIYVRGFCNLRQAGRTFRISRIQDLVSE